MAEKHLKAAEGYVSISYTEIADQWKEEVFYKETRHDIGKLAKAPG